MRGGHGGYHGDRGVLGGLPLADGHANKWIPDLHVVINKHITFNTQNTVVKTLQKYIYIKHVAITNMNEVDRLAK